MANFVKPYKNDPFVGHLSTPITTSAATRAILGNLPAYRPGLPSTLRGLEVGMAHGYFLVGPFALLGPLRNSSVALLAAFMSAAGLIIILSVLGGCLPLLAAQITTIIRAATCLQSQHFQKRRFPSVFESVIFVMKIQCCLY